MSDNILIVGAGAIGAFYGALLAKSGAHVTVVCRSDLATVQKQGYSINSRPYGQWTFQPDQVLSHAKEYDRTADYIILCSKITPDIDRVALIRDAVKNNSAIVFIQNGVEIEQELQTAFPNNEIISGLAFICCNRQHGGLINHLAYGKLTLGNYPSGYSTKTTHLAELFKRSGIECLTTPDIIRGRWIKCVWNAPFNPLSVLSGGLATSTILHQQEPLIRQIMDEVCTIAAANGHPLPANIVANNIDNTYKMPPYKTSMLLDFEQGRPMETEAILGNTIRAALRLNIPCPRLETLYALMQLIENTPKTPTT